MKDEQTGCALIITIILIVLMFAWIILDAGSRIRTLEGELRDVHELEKDVRKLQQIIDERMPHE